MTSSTRSALVVIAMRGFQDVELAGTVKGLQKHGFDTVICGKDKGGVAEGKFGGKRTIDTTMKEATPDGFDRIAFIGGPGARALADDPDAVQLAQRFADAGKIVGAICIAPTILAQAGLLRGKPATVWDSKQGHGPEAAFLTNHGAKFVHGEDVVVAGNIITANGPDAAEAFGDAFAQLQA